MDFNQFARDLIAEYKKYRVTDTQIAGILGLSRQGYLKRRDTNDLTTEDLTRLSAKIVTYFGGGETLFQFVNRYSGNVNADMTKARNYYAQTPEEPKQ